VEDREIECADCKDMFIFSGGEQEFYKKRGFQDPKRCKDCRQLRKEKKRDEEEGQIL